MKNWDFERWLLFVMAIVVAASGGFILWQASVAGELTDQLKPSEKKLADIGRMADEIWALKSEKSADGLLSSRDPLTYFEQKEVESKIGKKTFDINPGNPLTFEDGYVDQPYTLRPSSRAGRGSDDYPLYQFVNFLLAVQGSTQRMKVTRIRLTASGGTGDDLWKGEFTITDRYPKVEG